MSALSDNLLSSRSWRTWSRCSATPSSTRSAQRACPGRRGRLRSPRAGRCRRRRRCRGAAARRSAVARRPTAPPGAPARGPGRGRRHRGRGRAAPRRRWSPAASPPTGCRGATCTSSCSRLTSSGSPPGSWCCCAAPGAAPLGLFVTLVMVLLVATAELVLYTPTGPLVPALQLVLAGHPRHRRSSSRPGIFLLGGCRRRCTWCAPGTSRAGGGFPYTARRRLPGAAGLERLTFALHAFGFPIWTFAVIAGAIWAEAAWGRLLGLGPEGDLGVHHLGRLRRLPARPRRRPSVKRNAATWIAVLRLPHHADEPVRREHLLHRPALLRRPALTVR